MPFLLIVVGLVLAITAIQNTYAALGSQLAKDFSGSNGFLVWMLALIVTGAIGYIPGWERYSRWFLALILIAIVLAQSKHSTAQGGFFGNLLQQVKNPVAPPSTAPGTVPPTDKQPGDVTFSAPTASGRWGDIFKGGPLEFLSPMLGK